SQRVLPVRASRQKKQPRLRAAMPNRRSPESTGVLMYSGTPFAFQTCLGVMPLSSLSSRMAQGDSLGPAAMSHSLYRIGVTTSPPCGEKVFNDQSFLPVATETPTNPQLVRVTTWRSPARVTRIGEADEARLPSAQLHFISPVAASKAVMPPRGFPWSLSP